MGLCAAYLTLLIEVYRRDAPPCQCPICWQRVHTFRRLLKTQP